MHQEIHSRKRTMIRNAEKNMKKRERRNRSPLEQMTNSVSIVYNTLFDEYFTDRSKLQRNNIRDFRELIIEKIELFTEDQLKNLNPAALVGGFIILNLSGKSIESNKVEFVFENKTNGGGAIDYFKSLKVKKEDIIRYARFWITFL